MDESAPRIWGDVRRLASSFDSDHSRSQGTTSKQGARRSQRAQMYLTQVQREAMGEQRWLIRNLTLTISERLLVRSMVSLV